MRILFITDEYPWPPRSGYRQRIDAVLRILARNAEVDLLAVVLDDAGLPPPSTLLARHCVVVAGRRRESRPRRLARWVLGRSPRTLLWRDWSAPRQVLRGWADSGYDVVWFSHVPVYLALRDLVAVPHVVDLDNLESFVLAHRRAALASQRGRGALVRRGLAIADGLDARRWRRIEHQVARSAAAVVVCSALDRDRLGGANARIVRNGYEPVTSTGVGRRAGGGSVILMVGLLTYEANRDAAAHFGEHILPRVRRELAGAQFRVVGRYDRPEQVAGLWALPGVVVTGEVADIGAELAAADIAVVPIRFGGGTRIKILEAFAHRVPVVTTSVGSEGLDVVDGEHLLVADGAAEFAAACIRLLREPGLRERIVDAAYRLWRHRYRWQTLAPDVNAIVQEAAGRR